MPGVLDDQHAHVLEAPRRQPRHAAGGRGLPVLITCWSRVGSPETAGTSSSWSEQRGECWHGWPDEGRRRWPLDAPGPDGERPDTVAFCKELELR